MHNNCGDNCKISSCLNVDVLRNILRERLGKDIFSLFVKYLICNKCHTFLFNNQYNKCKCPLPFFFPFLKNYIL